MVAVEIIPDPEQGGFTARVPDIPAYGEGETEDEALADLKEALRGYIEAFGLEDAVARMVSPVALRHPDWDLKQLAGYGAGSRPATGENHEPPLPSGLLPIPPMIQKAQAAFRRDLPGLMETHYRQWVIYHGDQRLGFGRSQRRLIQECLRRGLKEDEFVVRCVMPDIPDDDEELEVSDR